METEEDTNKKQNASKASTRARGILSDRAMHFISRAVDIFTILISFVDVVSDIIVAMQFYDAGHMGWFWAVMASLLLSNVAYTVWCIESYDFNQCLQRSDIMKTIFGPELNYNSPIFDKVRRFLWVFPFAQLCPTLVWIAHELDTGGKSSDFIRHSSGERNDASAQELNDIEDASQFLQAMQSNLDAHLQSHALFYIETIVESIPQSIVQLLAVTMLGEVTEMQLFSMALSLVSIVSKAYLLSQSSDLRVFSFKFLLAAHDVFSLFYAFSSVISENQPHTTLLPGAEWVTTSQVLVSDHSAAWGGMLYRKTSIILGFFWTGVLALTIYENRRNRVTNEDRLKGSFIVGGFFCVMVVPFIFLGEGLKLSWFILLLFLLEPNSTERYPVALALRTFCNNGPTSVERANRVRHVFLEMVDWALTKVGRDEVSQHYKNTYEYNKMLKILKVLHQRENDSKLGPRALADLQATIDDVVETRYGDELEKGRSAQRVNRSLHLSNNFATRRKQKKVKVTQKPLIDRTPYDIETEEAEAKREDERRKRQNRKPNFGNDQRGDLTWRPWSVFWEMTVDINSALSQFKNEKWGPRVAGLCMTGAIMAQVVGALYSLVFPFLNAYHYPDQQNHFQLFCFTALTTCLILALTQLSHVLTFTYFSACLSEVQNASALDKYVVRQWINDYHRPSNEAILSITIPSDVVNHDLIGHCALFLSDAHLNKRGISLQDCRDMKKNQ